MSRSKRASDQNALRIRPKPFALAMLDDVEGGQEGLLPVSTQGKTLKMEFDPWENTDPSPQDPETVELRWDGDSVDIKTWTAPIAPDDYYINVPSSRLTNGRHEVDYLLTLRNGFTEPSAIRVLTVDTEPPILSADRKLKFDTDTISFDYLVENNDVVKANVPAYTSAVPGDVVVAKWKNPADGSSAEISTEPLTHLNYLDPIILKFTGDFIRDRGDGKRQVTYRITDRALNTSAESDPVELLVAAIRPPRYLPNPWVMEIEDSPSGWGELNPEKTLTGATVRIPAEAVYYEDDRVVVQFGEPGAVGSVTVPVDGDTRDVRIPKESIGAYLNKTLQVTYVIHLPDNSTESSGPLTLVIRAFAPPKLVGAQLASPHTDPAYKSNIPAAGLPIFQRIWPYISTRCLITITVMGTGTDNQPKTQTILDAKPVTEAQIISGVSATVTQAFMLGLKNDARFRVQTQVSFDNGGTWFPFTLLSPMLKP
ncbi:hypothetical protein [Pseudomonas izuensis]|uniref:hypothetical protein n=1 Tax=Pseudomonas izuensis TaxID=2684212 RepID=UPI001356E2BB|nr:hypothetical protein [Pseudomonas izuensis]